MVEQVSSLKTNLKYKDTPIGKIPVDWEVVRLGDICEVVGGTNPQTKNKEYRGGDIPFAALTDITDPRVRVISATRLKCNERADKLFVLYKIISFQQGMARRESSFIFKGGSKDICFLMLSLPPISEQKGITEILSTVDKAIEETTEIIAKTRELKKGMMQKLFTRGTGHKEVKKTEIQEIPEGWKVVILKDIAMKFCRGGTPDTKNKEYWDGDIPWIAAADFENQRVQQIRRHISLDAVERSATNIVPEGNLLVVTKIGVGKVAIAPFNVGISQDITGIMLDHRKAFPGYVYWYLDYQASRLKSIIQGTSINSLSRRDLESFLILLPPLKEQREIASILSCIDNEIEQETNYRERLKLLQKGLMQKLLRGKIRVLRA